MALFDTIRAGASGATDFEIERSLRFEPSDSARLSRTFTSAGNRKTFTLSAWVKRSSFGSTGQTIFACATDSSNIFAIYFPGEGQAIHQGTFSITDINGGSQHLEKNSTAKLRDINAWYHLVVGVDMTQSTAEDRVKAYINGERITEWTANTIPSQNTDLKCNQAEAHNVGRMGGVGNYFDGYMAEVNFIDGTQLTPASFAETDTLTGQWNPIKYTGSYGSNGFRLEFADNSGTSATTLGKDTSGNGNNFSPSNFSVSAGAGNDSLEDTPTNNFCTLSPLLTDTRSDASFSNGNLTVTTGSGASTIGTTFPQTTGKWYAEFVCTAKSSVNMMISVNSVEGFDGERQGNESQNGGVGFSYVNNGNRGDGSSYGASWAIGDVMGIALDLDNNTVNYYKNNSAQGTISITDGFMYVMTLGGGQAGTTQTFDVNFGQRAFTYTPPTGFKKLNSQNLPDPTIPIPSEYFDIVLYTGNSSNQTISSLSFQPDWVWIKRRQGENHFVTDSVRGAGKHLRTDSPSAESDDSATFTAFTSNGFSLTGSGAALPQVNTNGGTYVAWNWYAGTSFSNSAGSNSATIASSGSVNTSQGFSIVSYVGNATRDQKVYHALNAVPKFIIVKRRDGDNWIAYHAESVDSNPQQYYYEFQNQDAIKGASEAFMWDNISPDSNIFGIYSDGAVNNNGSNIIAYVFAEVAGYSKFGHYFGNGNDNGTYIALGFRPALVIVKSNASGESWVMYDSARDPFNAVKKRLQVNETSAEDEASGRYKDFYSNGFKAKGTSGEQNSSGQRYIFMAWAENPFKYARAS